MGTPTSCLHLSVGNKTSNGKHLSYPTFHVKKSKNISTEPEKSDIQRMEEYSMDSGVASLNNTLVSTTAASWVVLSLIGTQFSRHAFGHLLILRKSHWIFVGLTVPSYPKKMHKHVPLMASHLWNVSCNCCKFLGIFVGPKELIGDIWLNPLGQQDLL